MLRVQELCGLRIGWVRPGQLCLESKLGLNDFVHPNCAARFEPNLHPVCRKLCHEEVLTELLSGSQRHIGVYSQHNPVVEMLVPTTLFEFEANERTAHSLSSALAEHGARKVFGQFFDELESMARHLRNEGEGVDRGRWGTSVYMTTLWVREAPLFGAPSVAGGDLRLAGHIDLHRLPLAMFAETPGRVPAANLSTAFPAA